VAIQHSVWPDRSRFSGRSPPKVPVCLGRASWAVLLRRFRATYQLPKPAQGRARARGKFRVHSGQFAETEGTRSFTTEYFRGAYSDWEAVYTLAGRRSGPLPEVWGSMYDIRCWAQIDWGQ